ncbi:MAG: hypothetical protein UU84_C0009G0005 [Candidatus Yanofskybacteria bacterium GW2011_GWC2_41_9]|uniref:Uncharacterized protein n=1 Tax=Candidatus Yanofskybacteria bacterium GW2011_GWC2_41_9 TaxID=1619029 RepID=A0A0G0XQX6_9BACT|nr:MAG: hypothetical protein UU84_C0009G0005 [Candidatus Yanofskybacteria bacterium GW2011_GWC2_41_9]
MEEKKVSETAEKKRERRGIIKKLERKPLINERMSTEEKNERFYEVLRHLTKRR